MEAKYLALIILLLSLHRFQSTFGNKNVSLYASEPGKYDYCDFVIQWRVSVCMLETCKAGAAQHAFGIHGLWPADKTADEQSKEVIDCTGETYDSTKIAGYLRQEMENSWPSLTGKNDDFWKHQWDKHGKCFDKGDQTFRMVDYFSTGAALGNLYSKNMWKYLRKGGLKAGVAYPVNSIIQAILRGSGGAIGQSNVQLQCLNNPEKKKVVSQIFLCINNAGLTACPRRREMCSGSPMFPTIPYDYSDFVLQWRITACMTGECVKGRAKEAFAIHGLWPQKLTKNGEQSEEVTNCGGDEYDASQTKDVPNLKPLWPPMYDNKYDELWKGEWEKHGTCFDSGTYYVSDYFNAAVNLAGQYDILAYLQKDKFQLGQAYAVDAIIKSIRRGSGDTIPLNAIQIKCVSDPKSKKLVVDKIILCLNKAGKTRSCPTKRETCSGKPMIPAKVSMVAPVDSTFDE